MSAVKNVLIDMAPALSLRALGNEGRDVGRTKGGKMPVSFPGLSSSGRCYAVASV